MGFLDDLLGNTAADASKAAAADTYGKQQAATSGITQAGQNYATGMGTLAQGYQPWQQTGQVANDAVRNLMADPSSVRSLPGYQFQMDQGTRALDHSATAAGNLFSGKAGKAVQAYGQNLADTTYGNQLQRLLGVSQQGLGATQAGINTTGQGLTGQLGANTSAFNGNMQSAGTIGQGDIAAANAQTQGSQNLLNLGGSLIGSAFTGGMGGGLTSLLGSGVKSASAGSGMFNGMFGGGSPTGYGR